METTAAAPKELDPALQGLAEPEMWRIFQMLSEAPRASNKEGKARQVVLDWAKENSLKTTEDKAGNICVHVPATPGYEDRPCVIPQAHLDMVPVRAKGVKHDFENDPIELIRTPGDRWLRAKGTSLGADNALGLAMALALAVDKEAIHPEMKILITMSEETGCEGAFGFDPEAHGIDAKHRLWVNLDSEEAGVICTGSAGFKAVKAHRDVERMEPEQMGEGDFFEISISSMAGGHSADINKYRGNAHLEMGRFLAELPKGVKLVSIDGPDEQAFNAIASFSRAVIFVSKGDDKLIEKVREAVEDEQLRLAREWPPVEAMSSEGVLEMRKAVIEMTPKTRSEVKLATMTKDTHEQIVRVLEGMPNGVEAMDNERLRGLIRTSSNLGRVITGENGGLELGVSVRGNTNDVRDVLVERVERFFGDNGFTTETLMELGPWVGSEKSYLAKSAKLAYQRVTGGKHVRFEPTHGGLEPAILFETMEEKFAPIRAQLGIEKDDATSYGDTIANPHSVAEQADVFKAVVVNRQFKEQMRIIATGEDVDAELAKLVV